MVGQKDHIILPLLVPLSDVGASDLSIQNDILFNGRVGFDCFIVSMKHNLFH